MLASGSKAAPETGSDGSGYALAEEAGHHVTRLEPALTGFLINDPRLHLASGARTKAHVRLVPGPAEAADAGSAVRGRTVSEEIRESVFAEEDGELQWADDSISGIAVFQLSRIAAHLPEGTPLRLAIDLVPDLTEEELTRAMDPAKYVGRAPYQTERYLRDVVRPLLDANRDALGFKAEINV